MTGSGVRIPLAAPNFSMTTDLFFTRRLNSLCLVGFQLGTGDDNLLSTVLVVQFLLCFLKTDLQSRAKPVQVLSP